MSFLDWLRRIFGRPTPPMPTPPPPPPTGDLAVMRADLVAALNATRAIRSLPALIRDLRLELGAQSWAESMARANVLDHGNFYDRIASIYPGAAASEDIARGYPTVDSVVTGWMGDPPHRDAILGNYKRVGVGVARAGNGDLYWVADFGSA